LTSQAANTSSQVSSSAPVIAQSALLLIGLSIGHSTEYEGESEEDLTIYTTKEGGCQIFAKDLANDLAENLE